MAALLKNINCFTILNFFQKLYNKIFSDLGGLLLSEQLNS